MKVGNKVLAQSDENGALPSLYAASQDLPGASYVGPDGPLEMRGKPALVGRTAEASDPEAAKRLWTMSEELTGVNFGLSALPAKKSPGANRPVDRDAPMVCQAAWSHVR
jgi:hypothetical protein